MTLRHRVLQGGFYLAIRQGLGTAIGVVGVLVLTRRIGPENYGIYAAALGVFGFLQTVCSWGLNVYLVRAERGADQSIMDQALTLLLLLGCLGSLGAILLAPQLAHWTHIPALGSVGIAMFLALPFTLAGQAAMAQLERRLEYRTVALIELAAQVAYYAVALPLAFAGYGVWAAVLGWCAQQFILMVLPFRTARYTPRLAWNHADIREMIDYGLSFSSSLWIWQLRSLVNPLVVGRFAGANAVGYVALGIRMVEYLSFVRRATWRISIAALAQIQNSIPKLRQAVSEGLRLQLLAIGPVAVAFLWASPVIVPRFFGPKWTPSIIALPYIALAYVVNAMFSMHSSVLYVLRRNWNVSAFHVMHVALFSGSAVALVPRYGLAGYGLAELLALSSYVLIHLQVTRAIGSPRYGLAMIWLVAFGFSLFVHQVGWWPVVALAGAAALPATWSELNFISRHLLEFRRA